MWVEHPGVQIVMPLTEDRPYIIVGLPRHTVRLGFDFAEWTQFYAAVHRGEFDIEALKASSDQPESQPAEATDGSPVAAGVDAATPAPAPNSPAGRLSDQPSSGGAERADQPGPIIDRIRAYADLLASSAGTVPDIDVAWKLRAILGEESDAEVTYSAPVKLREMGDAQRAARHLCSRIIASAHLLDVPFTDAPDQSPWTLMKRDMAALYAAVGIRFAPPGDGEQR